MNPVPIDLEKVKRVVDALTKGESIDAIMDTMEHGFGDVVIKVTVSNGAIKLVTNTTSKTVKIE